MQTKRSVLNFSLALLEAGDGALLEDKKLLEAQGFNRDDKDKVGKIWAIVRELCHDYSYTSSSSFKAEVACKSPEFASMKLKIESDPAKKKNRMSEFFNAIEKIVENSDLALSLASSDQLVLVAQLERLVQDLSIPTE